MNVAYFALTIGVVVGCYFLAGPFVSFILWLFSFDILPVLIVIGKVFLVLGGLTVVLYFGLKSQVFVKCSWQSSMRRTVRPLAS